MHQKFLPYLCCPETKEPFELVAEEIEPNGFVNKGFLRTSSGKEYVIVRGIPRFVSSENYVGSFGFEWKRWPRVQFESENVGRPMEGHTTKMWETITGSTTQNFDRQTLVEFGCGSGRFLDVVLRKNGIAIGIDMSMAVEAARKNFGNNPDVLIVQGDIMQPPFCPDSFDGGYTIGVLHHTPMPESGLAALANTVKRGGWVACSVYHKRGFYAYPSVAHFRKFNNWVKPYFGYRLAILYSYFSAYFLTPFFRLLRKSWLTRVVHFLEKHWLPCLYIPDVHWRVLDIFDGITPVIASTHTRAEVIKWMKGAGCRDLAFPNWGDTAITGIKD